MSNETQVVEAAEVAVPAKVRKPRVAKSKAAKPRAAKSKKAIDGKLIPANTEKYTKAKSASGAMSLHNGDEVARRLAGKDLDDVYAIVAKAAVKAEHKKIEGATTEQGAVTKLKAAYKSLNVGMQRMNLGNILRGC